MEHFNKYIEEALKQVCINKGISENTLKKIETYLDALATDSLSKSELDINVENILSGIMKDTGMHNDT